MDKRVAELLNDQINKELYSAYLYLDMANFYAAKGWTASPTTRPSPWGPSPSPTRSSRG